MERFQEVVSNRGCRVNFWEFLERCMKSVSVTRPVFRPLWFIPSQPKRKQDSSMHAKVGRFFLGHRTGFRGNAHRSPSAAGSPPVPHLAPSPLSPSPDQYDRGGGAAMGRGGARHPRPGGPPDPDGRHQRLRGRLRGCGGWGLQPMGEPGSSLPTMGPSAAVGSTRTDAQHTHPSIPLSPLRRGPVGCRCGVTRGPRLHPSVSPSPPLPAKPGLGIPVGWGVERHTILKGCPPGGGD